jgi:hypothetical protein
VVISASLVRFRQSAGGDQVSNRWNYTSIVRERSALWSDAWPSPPLRKFGFSARGIAAAPSRNGQFQRVLGADHLPRRFEQQ